jgi:hypothetical protein
MKEVVFRLILSREKSPANLENTTAEINSV